MRKHDLLRAIYAELRSSLDAGVAAVDVLRLADYILRVGTGQEEVEDDSRIGGSQALISLPVDVAMQDGGWRILELEESMRCLQERDIEILAITRSTIERYLGPEWKHPSLARPL